MENIRRLNPNLQAGNVNPTPVVRAGETEPLVPIASDGLDLQGTSATIEARPVLVPLTLAQRLVALPNAGLHVAGNACGPSGLGVLSSPPPAATLSASTVPTPRLDAKATADRAIADVVRHSSPETAPVKAALFQVLRQRQPDLSPDAIHAANQFVESSRTPQEMGVRLLSLVKMYQQQPNLDSDQLNAIHSYADAAPTTEESIVRLWGLANMLKGGADVTPDKLHALSASLEDFTGLANRHQALDHVVQAGGKLSAAGISPFLSTIYDSEGGAAEVRRDAAYQIARNTPEAFG